MAHRAPSAVQLRTEGGQALLLLLGVVAAVMLGTLVLTAFGQALGGRAHQRAADLAAVSAAASMRRDYQRLFEPALLDNGAPNPRHLSPAFYEARARAAGTRAGRRNGVSVAPSDVSFPGGSFAPTRVTVRVQGTTRVRIERRRPRTVAVKAKATAELAPGEGAMGQPASASGGGYDGPLAYRQGKPMRPDVARAFDRMAAAARAAPASRSRSRAPSAPTPSRRASSPPTPIRNGSRLLASRSTALARSSTSAHRRPTAGLPRTHGGSASSSAIPGKPGTTAIRTTRAAAPWASRAGGGRTDAEAPCPHSSRRGSRRS